MLLGRGPDDEMLPELEGNPANSKGEIVDVTAKGVHGSHGSHGPHLTAP